jgi:hypothetical protein
MFDFASTIVAALIGSIIGSVGAVLADHWMTGRNEKFRKREMLVQRYLFQLQDALEMLWYRFRNLVFHGGQYIMTEEYYVITTLYALGRVLALERIFALEAVYPQLDAIYPGLGKLLKEQDYRIERQLSDSHFFQFNRLSLAEAVIVHEGDSFRSSTFLEFWKLYETDHALEKQWLEPATDAIRSLSQTQMNKILDTISKKAITIAEKTSIDTSIHVRK